MNFSRFRQVGDAGVWAHQNIGWVKGSFKEATLAFTQMNTPERSLREVVRLDQCQAVDADLMDRVDGLKDAGHPLE